MSEVRFFQLSTEDIAFCAALGLEKGYDDDAEDKHQYTHICWPYDTWEGTLCQSDRLWGHAGVINEKSEIDCAACVEHLCTLRYNCILHTTPMKELFAAFGKLAGAVDTLSVVRNAANNLVDFSDSTVEENERLFAAGYPPPSLESIRVALADDHARHVANIDAKPPKT